MNGVGAGCTTTQHKPHGTEVEICYRWHPWYGRTVHVIGSVSKQSGTVLRVCNELNRGQSREIPVWMADSAICALLKFSKVPMVDVEALGALAGLLDRIVCRDDGGVIETPHPGFLFRGDTDASETTRRPSVATRFTATTANDTEMGGSAAPGQGARAVVAGAASKGSSRRLRGRRKSKGGGQ
jgi:hypothetical protein